MTTEYPYIVADIGGTNSRFGLVTENTHTPDRFQIEFKQKYPSNQFENIDQATRHYLDSLNEQHSLNDKKIKGACLAVAGPVINDKVSLTNLNWHFSIDSIKHSLELQKLRVINDFAAYAFATQYVAPENLISINNGQKVDACPMAIVGPGTGFGVAALVPQKNSWQVIPSEGGHITLASKSSLQAEIISVLSKEMPHVSVESVLSGPGLSNLYRALAAVEGGKREILQAAEISQIAKSDVSSLSYRTLRLFCKWLGQATGDLTITLGARGGVYLCGGILKRNTEFFLQSEFIDGFLDKGHMQEYLSQIPVQLVTENDSALLGAAACFNL
jgi:glucokinase